LEDARQPIALRRDSTQQYTHKNFLFQALFAVAGWFDEYPVWLSTKPGSQPHSKYMQATLKGKDLVAN
jgi:hypothetical protein